MKITLKFNREKRIGTVIYFVEGQSTEFTLLRTIFGKILNYDFIEKRRGKPAWFKDNSCPQNRVYVINTSESNISDISDKDFLDEVCELLINEYGLDADNAAKFYIFDRDNQSNTDEELIQYYLKVLNEPYGDDTENEKGGLLILSFPAIESFVISNFLDNTHELQFKIGQDVKTFIGSPENQKLIQYNKINEGTLLHAAKEFVGYLVSVDTELELDLVGELNKFIYQKEEETFDETGLYRAVSELILSLMYMGIIEIENDDCDGTDV